MGLKWEKYTIGDVQITKRTVVGGKHSSGEKVYVGRVKYLDNYLPAKVIVSPESRSCVASHNGAEISFNEFELLLGDSFKFEWVPASFGDVDPHSVSPGNANGEEVFVGRAVFNGSMIIGRVSENDKCLFIPFDGKEHKIEHYEVLVYHSNAERRRSTLGDILVYNVGGII
jgi:hypothetical protein